MKSPMIATDAGHWAGRRMNTLRLALALILPGAVGGCVQVTAPEKPIEIVLTINIRQEVVYRLDSDAKALIEQNTEIF